MRPKQVNKILVPTQVPDQAPIVNSNGEVIFASPVVLVDSNGEIASLSGGESGGDASAANQQTQIELETSIRNRLSSSDNDVIFTKLNELLTELQQKTEPSNTQLVNIGLTNWQRLQFATDLVQAFSYLDAGTADERISTIVYSSVSLSLSITETYTYAGSAGNYRLSTITRS